MSISCSRTTTTLPRICARGFDAQWNDDAHHVLHVLLTGESEGYYEDYADRPAERLARCLEEGFVYQGEPSAYRGGKPRGTPSADLPPTAFVLFLQNHDQIGNRAFGDRLTRLAASRGARGRDRPAAALPANPAAVHGRGRSERARRSCSSPITRRTGGGRARRPAPRVRELRAISDPKHATKFPIRTPPRPSSAPSRSLMPRRAGDRERLYRDAAGAAPAPRSCRGCRRARRRRPARSALPR